MPKELHTAVCRHGEPTPPVEMPTIRNNDTLVWVGSNQIAEQYVAVNVDTKNWKYPHKVGTIKNQDLHAL